MHSTCFLFPRAVDSAPLSIPERTGRATIFVTPPVGAFSVVGIGSEALQQGDQLGHPFGRTGHGHRLLRRLPPQACDLRTRLLGDERARGQVPRLQAALVVEVEAACSESSLRSSSVLRGAS